MGQQQLIKRGHLIDKKSPNRLQVQKNDLQDYEYSSYNSIPYIFYIMIYFSQIPASQMPSVPTPFPDTFKIEKKTSLLYQDQNSQSFQPEYHQLKKLGMKVNKRKISSGLWTPTENQAYLKFLKRHIDEFRSQKSRRKKKVFFRLSKILKKRTPDQCRSHHQKLHFKNKEDLQAIIKDVQQKVEIYSSQNLLIEKQVEQRQKVSDDLLEPNREVTLSKYVCVIDKGWFDIKSFGCSLIISIDPKSLGEW